MKPVLFLGILLITVAADFRAMAEDHGVEIRVAGLRVVGDGYGEGAEKILPLNWRSGTTISLMVNGGDGSVLDLDAKASRLLVFEDDKGTDLLPDPDTARPAFGLFPQRSADRKVALIEIWGDGRAATNARELRIKGLLALRMGGEKTTERTEAIAPRIGAAATLGSRTVSVLAGLPFSEEEEKGEKEEEAEDEADLEGTGKVVAEEMIDEKLLSLRFDGNPEGIANVRILDKDLNPIEVELLEVRVVHRGGVRSIHRMELPEDFDGDIVIEANVWDEPKTVQVPFEAKVSVGLR